MVRSIRWRLQAWYTLVLLTVIGGFAGALYYRTRLATWARIDAQVEGAATFLEATLRSFPPHEVDSALPFRPQGPPDRPAPPPPPGSNRPPPPGPGRPREGMNRDQLLSRLDLRGAPGPVRDAEGELYFIVWRADGSVLKASDNLPFPMPKVPPQEPLPPRPLTQGPDRQFYLQGPRGCLLLVGKPTQRDLNDLAAFAWQLGGSGAAALAIGLLGGWLISARILRPLQAIAETADAISTNNLSQRIATDRIDTELEDLAEVLNAMFARLETEFERQTRFTADASHELRTPLAVLYSQLELALSRPRTEAEYRDTLQRCLAASARMRSLVDGLLTLARADAGRLDLATRPVDTRHVVEEAAAPFADQAEQAGVTLAVSLPPKPVVVRGDVTFLVRVLSNLVANALRHTPRGGKVQVAVAAERGEAVLTVADTGSGIPEKHQPRVFERFFRADSSRARASGGNGLGLAICKSLVKAHGGSIAFTSQPETGTIFLVRLPLAEKDTLPGVKSRTALTGPKV